METEVLVIGAGLAGLMTALSLQGRSVTLLSKGPLLGEDTASSWAQGGISAALAKEDSPHQHQLDTLAVAGGIADASVIELVTRLAREGIETLMRLGVEFDRDGIELSLRREAAHSYRRVVHARGDSTGREIMKVLRQRVQESNHIVVLEGAEAIDLISVGKRICGAILSHQGRLKTITASAVVLATGGVGQIFAATTNPASASGDGLAMAARAGVLLRDLEFVQFHPTAMNVGHSPSPLATEALRGDGGFLVNDLADRFMRQEHPMADLAPRDIVARAMWRQIEQGRKCFLDVREAVGSRITDSFPTVFRHCQDHGIDPRNDLIPVTPAAHYHMGGVAVDNLGRSSLAGLWACGEVACTGLHGANRLASNSLLEALVFGPLVARDIEQQSAPDSQRIDKTALGEVSEPETQKDRTIISELQILNYRHLGVCRDEQGLRLLLNYLDELEIRHALAAPKLKNLITCSRLIATAALRRQESRGGHYRTDYPDTNTAFQQSMSLTLADCNKPSFLPISHIPPDKRKAFIS